MRIKTFVLNEFRKLLTPEIVDRKLANLLRKYPKSMLLRKITPGNALYLKESKRICNRHGINYTLDISDYPDWSLYFYSKTDSSLDVISYASLGDTVLDIGGNIGQTALMLAQQVGKTGKVISFEPYPNTIKRFEENLKLNNNINNVTLEKFALGDKETIVAMYQHCQTNSAGNRILSSDMKKTDGITEVVVKVLDEYISRIENLKEFNLIKIDVEGFETQVLKGAKKTLLKHKPNLFIEVNDEMLKKQGSSANELLNILRDLGYSIIDVATKKTVLATDGLPFHTDIYCTQVKSDSI